MSSATRIVGLFVCTLVTACAGGSDGTVAPQTVIHPGGGGTGALVVTAPSIPSGAVGSGTVYRADAQGTGALALTLGTPVTLDPDTYCVTWDNLTDCTVKITASQTTTYALGAIHATYDPSLLATDLQVVAQLNIVTSDGKPVKSGVNALGNEVYFVTLPGSYTTTCGLQSGFPGDIPVVPSSSVTVPPGVLVEWPIRIPEWRFTVHVIVPERVYPDVSGGYSYVLTGFNAQAAYATPTSDLTLHVPPAGAATAYNYNLSVFGMTMTIAAGAAATQIDVPISRIDVDDVGYTRPDGTAATVPGTWKATRKGGAPGPVADTPLTYYEQSSFPTSHGIDVFAGKYDGVVSFNLQDLGGQQGYDFDITF